MVPSPPRLAQDPADYAAARQLFEEYAAGLGVDLCFQGFAEELDRLPQMYGPPSGALFLAESVGTRVATVAVRRVSADTCEMKRLYVREAHRGEGLGRALALAAIGAGKSLGYRRIVLDTLESMTEARALYRSLGFVDTAPYYDNPLPGTAYLAKAL